MAVHQCHNGRKGGGVVRAGGGVHGSYTFQWDILLPLA